MATTTFYDATFGVRAIGNRTDNAGSAVDDLSAEEDRFDNLDIGEGYIAPSDAFLVAAVSGWAIDIGSGDSDVDLFVVEGALPGQGNYIVRLDQAGASITVTAADGSNPRIDEVYLIVADDAYDGNSLSLPRLALRTGDAAASPSAPGPDSGWDAYALLATIEHPTSGANIGAATITDERQRATLVIDAISLDGNTADEYSPASHNHDFAYADIAHEDSTTGHPSATTELSGFMSAADKLKLDGIEADADVNRTAGELLTDILTVDGSGSGIDADLLDGQHASSFATSGHNHDSRYYTESEVDALFLARSDAAQAVRARRSSSSVSVPNVTLTELNLNTDDQDDWGGHSLGDGSIADEGAGFYLAVAQVEFAANATGFRQIQIQVSGVVKAVARVDNVGASDSSLLTCAVALHASGSSVFDALVYHEAGGALSYSPDNTHFRVLKLGGN